MGAPNFCSARSTISMARSTPAQKPRGSARTTSSTVIGRPSKHADQLDVERHRPAGQRMVEVEHEGAALDLTHDPGEAALAVGRRKAHDVAHPIVLVGVAVLVE